MMEGERSEELKITHTSNFENSGTISEIMQEEEHLPLCVCVPEAGLIVSVLGI